MSRSANAQIFDLGGNDFGGGESEVKATVTPSKAKRGDTVLVTVELTMPPGSHTYPITKSIPGGGATIIEIKGAGVTPVDKVFKPDRKPLRKVDEILKQTVEVFKDKVTWSRQYLVNGNAPDEIKLSGKIDGQVCDRDCRFLEETFDLVISVSGPKVSTPTQDSEKKPAVYKTVYPKLGPMEALDDKNPSKWTITLEPKDAKPGDTVTVSLHAELAKGYHTFASDQDPQNLGLPTVIKLKNLTGLKAGKSDQLETKDKVEIHLTDDGKRQRIHHDSVTWTRQFVVAEGAEETGFGLSGRASYQVCTASSCRRGGFNFVLGTTDPSQDITSSSTSSGNDQPAGPVSEKAKAVFQDLVITQAKDERLGTYLLYAFLGGLILNIMPCVLPVIAIKALSFVQQSGEDRKRIFSLNMAYSAGVVAVFLVLATLAWRLESQWGDQFRNSNFTLIMASIVFAMGLSLIGVFDIPIPGFVGSAGAQQREGLPGAFLTGVFATVLATPCSGPFLGTALAWSVNQKDPITIYSVWGMMGIGMAFPYMLFAISPAAIKMLPKPGNWMVRFKQFSGFVLLGTAIFVLASLPEARLISALVTLLGVGLSCWMLGNMQDLMSSKKRRWTVRACSLAVCLGAVWLSNSMYQSKMNPDESAQVAWEKFDLERIAVALDEGQPVLIDFTADWCLTCKVLEKVTLNTEETVAKINQRKILAMKADMTLPNETMDASLKALNRTAIPTLAIFNPKKPKEPVILFDWWSQSYLLEQLDIAAGAKEAAEVSVDANPDR